MPKPKKGHPWSVGFKQRSKSTKCVVCGRLNNHGVVCLDDIRAYISDEAIRASVDGGTGNPGHLDA